MAKYSEIVALLEWVDRKSTQKQPKRTFKGFKSKDIDIPAYIKRKREEVDTLEKYLKDSAKKDDKKADEKKMRTFTGIEWFIIGIISYPILGPAYQALAHNLILAVPK